MISPTYLLKKSLPFSGGRAFRQLQTEAPSLSPPLLFHVAFRPRRPNHEGRPQMVLQVLPSWWHCSALCAHLLTYLRQHCMHEGFHSTLPMRYKHSLLTKLLRTPRPAAEPRDGPTPESPQKIPKKYPRPEILEPQENSPKAPEKKPKRAFLDFWGYFSSIFGVFWGKF